MVGYGQLTLGSVFIIIGILLFVVRSWSVYTYFEGIKVVENEKKDRNFIESLGGDTTGINETIEDHENNLNFKKSISTFCSFLGLILLIIGVFLIMNWRKEKNRKTKMYYSTRPSSYPPYPTVLQNSQQYYQNPQSHPPEQVQPYPPKQQ